jgi:hypothetical protein
MHRSLQPELLDSLPVDHPAALHNRRDLRLTNQIAGNHRWFSRRLPPLLRPGELALELGAGTGELGRRLQRIGVPSDGLDLWPRPADWPAERAWHRNDLRTFDGLGAYAAVCGNLIFHQFSDQDLASLGRQLRRHVRLILACEPARRRSSQFLYRVFGTLLGANYVSLHDAHVSIAGGFRRDELATAMGLDDGKWRVQCHTTLLGINRLIALRRA